MLDSIELVMQARITELEEKISQARHGYYNSVPVASDEEYDAWVDELATLKEDSPEVTAIGAPATSSWPKVTHEIPMGSLSKVQSMDEMTSWVHKISREKGPASFERLIVTEKLDGISVSLKYDSEGRLVQALTRGDGMEGEDITPNVARMKGVPKKLPVAYSAICRGEIILLKEDLQKHFPEASNSRNTASGTAKRLDGRGCEHLTVMVYQALEVEGAELTTEQETFAWLESVGFQTPRWYMSAMAWGQRTPQDIWVDYQQSVRESLPYDIDGLVVRVDDLVHQWSLGETNGRPIGAVAFKFTAITRDTVALERVDQVGGTGRITPVAVFKPVRILGAEVSRASLYNQRYIEEIGFQVGCRILVSRANDVIPRVVSTVTRMADVSQPPERCPECGAPTERDGEYIVCPNVSECPAQTEGRIKQWIKELGIMEWGGVLIQKVVTAQLVKSVPDLYRLTVEDLAALDRMGIPSAKKARDELWKVVPLPLEHFLGALGIPLCASSTMQTVVDAGYDTLESLRALTGPDSLMEIPGMGPKRARSLYSWLGRNWQLIDDMLEAGITIRARSVGTLTGKSVCFTGKSVMKRAELVSLVEGAGGVVKRSVGKGLDYLVMADPSSSSSKAQSARKMGTACITEDALLRLIQEK